MKTLLRALERGKGRSTLCSALTVRLPDSLDLGKAVILRRDVIYRKPSLTAL